MHVLLPRRMAFNYTGDYVRLQVANHRYMLNYSGFCSHSLVVCRNFTLQLMLGETHNFRCAKHTIIVEQRQKRKPFSATVRYTY